MKTIVSSRFLPFRWRKYLPPCLTSARSWSLESVESNENYVAQVEQSRGLNVTGRKYRDKKYRNNLESIVSLPSATKVKETLADTSLKMRDYIEHVGLENVIDRIENLNKQKSDRSVSSGYTGSSDSGSDVSQMLELGSAECSVSDDADHGEVSGIEPLSKTEIDEDNSDVNEFVHDNTTSSDISHANSTVNSGIVTFREDTSASGVYDSFSDDTQNEFIDDTEVQEDLDDTSNLVVGVKVDENPKMRPVYC
eukprot:GFUD01044836.1.p1 GENE.GFUD01044836.1~~GFUD01044836.1.p1  ORF type:complete len:252 (-),score=50.69 GFUD01044836.1:203-958(-)